MRNKRIEIFYYEIPDALDTAKWESVISWQAPAGQVLYYIQIFGKYSNILPTALHSKYTGI